MAAAKWATVRQRQRMPAMEVIEAVLLAALFLDVGARSSSSTSSCLRQEDWAVFARVLVGLASAPLACARAAAFFCRSAHALHPCGARTHCYVVDVHQLFTGGGREGVQGRSPAALHLRLRLRNAAFSRAAAWIGARPSSPRLFPATHSHSRKMLTGMTECVYTCDERPDRRPVRSAVGGLDELGLRHVLAPTGAQRLLVGRAHGRRELAGGGLYEAIPPSPRPKGLVVGQRYVLDGQLSYRRAGALRDNASLIYPARFTVKTEGSPLGMGGVLVKSGHGRLVFVVVV